MMRGAEIARCDQARRLAVDTFMAERAAGEAARSPPSRRRWRLFGI